MNTEAKLRNTASKKNGSQLIHSALSLSFTLHRTPSNSSTSSAQQNSQTPSSQQRTENVPSHSKLILHRNPSLMSPKASSPSNSTETSGPSSVPKLKFHFSTPSRPLSTSSSASESSKPVVEPKKETTLVIKRSAPGSTETAKRPATVVMKKQTEGTKTVQTPSTAPPPMKKIKFSSSFTKGLINMNINASNTHKDPLSSTSRDEKVVKKLNEVYW